MDERLLQSVEEKSKALANTKGPGRVFNIVDAEKGAIEVAGGEGGEAAMIELRPLDELCGQGTGADVVNPMDERFMPLFLGIEEAIQLAYREDRGLTDGAVQLALNELSMNPSAETRDGLARRVQLQMRMVLSLNDYSKQEVKGAVRKIAKSVERHRKSGGPRGYLEFVRGMLRM
ncbi:MAG TPA: hypothetical protein VH475_08945 [Tepidisphaeraceae bacterium]|jgi:hypothetical protein